MDSKSIRNHRSVSEDESQIVYGFSLLQSFPEGKRKSYHVQNEECVAGGGALDKCLLSQAASMVGLVKRTRISWRNSKGLLPCCVLFQRLIRLFLTLFCLFLSFRRVLNVNYSFLGNSPASEF